MSLSLIFTLLKETALAWQKNNLTRWSASLAFYSILSLSPLIILLLTAATVLWGHASAQGEIANEINNLVGTQSAQAVQSILESSAANKSEGLLAGLIAFLSLLLSASAMFSELQESINFIWHTPSLPKRPWYLLLREKITSCFLVIGSGLFLIISVIASAALAAATHYITGIAPPTVTLFKIINLIISFSIFVILFALIFKSVPSLSIPWISVWPGSLLTSSLFICGKGLIGIYLGHTGVASSYGAAGSIIVLLLWIYYSAQIFFFGAQFTYLYFCHHQSDDTRDL